MSALVDDAATAPPVPAPEPPAARRPLTAVPDRAAREAAAAVERLAYCARLREERLRRGITLREIAQRTKVNESLYAALERADVSRWPTGIYRRSFFRDYVAALGLPVDAALHEFEQLFPEPGERTPQALAAPPGPLRMTLAARPWQRPSRLQTAGAAIDLVMVALITAAVAWWMPVGVGTVAAVVSLIYYSLATCFLACSPGAWWLRTRGNRKRVNALRLAR